MATAVQAVAPPAPRVAVAVWQERTSAVRAHALAFGGYLALTAILLAPVLGDPTRHYLGSIPDAMQSIWFLSWTADGLAHHHALLFSGALNAPSGVNLTWNTPMTLLGVVAAPITLTLGPVAAYNVLIAAAFSGSAWLGYRAIERFCDNRPASWIGGLMFGFSPYMLAQSLGHLDLVAMFFPPLALILLDEIVVRQRRRGWVSGGLLGLATAAQVLVMEELVAAVAVGVIALLVLLGPRAVRRASPSLRHCARAGAAAVATCLVVAGWPLWYQLTGPQVPPGLSEVANVTGTDLAALVTPTANQALAPPPGAAAAASFVAQSTGQDGYLGIPLLVLLAVIAWSFRREPRFRVMSLSALGLAVLSLGPWLTVMGRTLPVPLPWVLVERVPLLGNLVPLRLMGLADLCIAALVAWALARAPSLRRPRRVAILALSVLALATWLPSLPRPAETVPPSLPSSLAHTLQGGGAVLFAPLPSQADTDPMWYELRESFGFRLAGGYAYSVQPDIPLARALDAPDSAVESATRDVLQGRTRRADVVAGYRALGVRTVVVPPGAQSQQYRALFTAVCGVPPRIERGFASWRLADCR